MDLTEIRNRVMKRAGVMNVDDVDAEINYVQRQYIQPVAQITEQFAHETTEEHESVPVPSDMYRINYVHDVTDFKRGTNIPIVAENRTDMVGVRVSDGNIQLLGVMPEREILISYYKLLPDLEPGGVVEPIIPERWHDLYWLGTLAAIMPEGFYEMFVEQLYAFKHDRLREAHPHGARLSPRGWW